MKRYLAFQGEDLHPRGGMGDFIGDFEDLAEAIKACVDAKPKRSLRLEDPLWDWAHVYDQKARDYKFDSANLRAARIGFPKPTP